MLLRLHYKIHQLPNYELHYLQLCHRQLILEYSLHNHFCIYCGAKLVPNQHFCTQCGKEVYYESEPTAVKTTQEYKLKIDEIEEDYNSKQARAKDLVGKLFDPTHISYSKFNSAITKSNQLFANRSYLLHI